MKVGDKVTWESQSSGYVKTKTGTVITEVPAGHSARRHIPGGAKKSHIKFDVDKSVYDRMLVAVQAGKDGNITHYYCPRKSVLTAQGKLWRDRNVRTD